MDEHLYFSSGMDHRLMISGSLDLFLRLLEQLYPIHLVPYEVFEECRVMLKGQHPKILNYYYLRESVRRDGARARQTGDNDKSRTG